MPEIYRANELSIPITGENGCFPQGGEMIFHLKNTTLVGQHQN